MSQLSAQSIHKLCQPQKWWGLRSQQPMISPYLDHKEVINGKSCGLSSCSYDVRIAHDLVLGLNPLYQLQGFMSRNQGYLDDKYYADLFRTWVMNFPYHRPHYALANTLEDFCIPPNVCGYVCDKSSFARVFVTAFNTLFDAGFQGNGTLELVNLGPETVEIKAGDPICQFVFHWLDRKTDRPYCGKYTGQSKQPNPARYELADGTWKEGRENARV